MPVNCRGVQCLARKLNLGTSTLTKTWLLTLPLFHNRMGYHEMRQEILLECGCRLWFEGPIPVIGDMILCRRHNMAAKRVKSVDWAFKCEDCRYGRVNLGNAKLTAEVMATKHALNRKHRVRIYCTSERKITSVSYAGRSFQQIQLDDEPPF